MLFLVMRNWEIGKVHGFLIKSRHIDKYPKIPHGSDRLIIKLHFFSNGGLLEACLGRPRRLSGQITMLFTSATSIGKIY